MPMVGKKEYPYTAKGIAMAKAAAKKSGKPMKKGYALGGPTTPMEGEQSRYRPSANRAPQGMMSARGMTSGMVMNKGGMPKKKAYAKGGKVAMYSEGGMVKNTSELNTGIKKAKNTYK